MTQDERTAVVLVVAFAALVTAHVTLVVGLAFRRPRWRAVAAALAFPLAPYWGARSGMFVRSAAWLVSAAAYAVFLWKARQ